jgi:cell division protein FtsZ
MGSTDGLVGRGAKLLVVGVGGGGCNAADAILSRELPGVEVLGLNTDAQALEVGRAPRRFQLGRELTRGLGAGADPEIGRAAALADREALAELVHGADLVFVCVGLGGGTGTGAAPVVAEVAREAGALTVGLATLPFAFEGKRRARLAADGAHRLGEQVDTLLTVPNERLLALVQPRTPIHEAFARVDDTLARGVSAVATLVAGTGHVNVDFADVRTVLARRGRALLGVGSGRGPHRAVEAVHAAIASPLLQDQRLHGARNVLLNVSGPADLGLHELAEAASLVADEAHEDVNLIWGWVPLAGARADEVEVTLLATGFDDDVRGASTRFEAAPTLKSAAVGGRGGARTPHPDDYDIPSLFRSVD